MSSTIDWLEYAAIKFLRAYSISGTPLTVDQVIRAFQPGPRPTADYLSVQVVSLGRTIDSWIEEGSAGGLPTESQVAHKEASISVHAYGPEAMGWLERALGHLDHSSYSTTMANTGGSGTSGTTDLSGIRLTVPRGTGLRDLTALRDVGFERHVMVDLTATYRTKTATEAGVPVESVVLSGTLTHPSAPSDLSITATIDMT